MLSNKLTCKEFVELVAQYIEQTLLPEMQALIESHLEDCPGCVAYLEQIRKTICVLREQALEPVKPMKPETKQEILQAFRNCSLQSE